MADIVFVMFAYLLVGIDSKGLIEWQYTVNGHSKIVWQGKVKVLENGHRKKGQSTGKRSKQKRSGKVWVKGQSKKGLSKHGHW